MAQASASRRSRLMRAEVEEPWGTSIILGSVLIVALATGAIWFAVAGNMLLSLPPFAPIKQNPVVNMTYPRPKVGDSATAYPPAPQPGGSSGPGAGVQSGANR